MMRVVQIGPYPESPDRIRGGVEASVFGLAHEQGQNMEIHVFDLPRMEVESTVKRDGNVTVHRFTNLGRRQVSMARQIGQIIQEIVMLKPDICHIHGTGLFSWLMYCELKKEKLPVLVTVHGLIRVEKWNQLKAKYSLKRLVQYLYQGSVEKRFLMQLPIAIVDTEYVKQMIATYPIRRKPEMYVIPQGINEDFFSLNCSQESRILLSVGAIGGRKGHLLTLEAFERLRKEGVEAELIVAGTIAEQGYYERILQFVNSSEYKDSIYIMPNLPQQELLELYKKAHLFVLHSEEESQGIVFAEAMSTGMPVISTEVGGVPYVVHHGECGLLSEYGEIQTFKENIRILLEDTHLWQAMSKAAKKYAEVYHWSIINYNILKLYNYFVNE